MLIYEKNNKLNINFDNEISENPDLQIGKEDGKTSITIDGQQSGGGGTGALVAHVVLGEHDVDLDVTPAQVDEALKQGIPVVMYYERYLYYCTFCTLSGETKGGVFSRAYFFTVFNESVEGYMFEADFDNTNLYWVHDPAD